MNIFQVINGNLIHLKKETVNTGSKNFFKVQFEFDSSWEEYSKLRFLEFYQNKDGQHYKVSIGNDNIVTANIPTKVLVTNLPIYVGVVAESYDSTIIANTNFLPITINYGGGTKESFLITQDEELYQLYAPDKSVRYLRINNNVLEYSSDKIKWEKVSSAIISGVSEKRLEEVVNKTLEEAKQYTDNEIATFDFVKIVDTLPEVGLPNREYFVRKESADTSDLFDEWAWINKGTEEEPNYGWEFKGTKQFEVDLTDYVKNTDYASKANYGLVRFGSDSFDAPLGIFKNTVYPNFGANAEQGGGLTIAKAKYAEIDARSPSNYTDSGANGANHCKPIVPANSDYTVFAVLTDPKIEVTEEQKEKICKTIGALPKVFNPNASQSIIKISKEGVVSTNQVASALVGGAVVERVGSSNIIVPETPTDNSFATSKKYVDNLIASLQAQIDELKAKI